MTGPESSTAMARITAKNRAEIQASLQRSTANLRAATTRLRESTARISENMARISPPTPRPFGWHRETWLPNDRPELRCTGRDGELPCHLIVGHGAGCHG